jgi:L-ascorbate metabolism protein UlaG (beta-lactamase superfamily)
MHISWLGQTCVRLQTKNQDEEVTVLIDPYKPDNGDFPRSFTPQIALYSQGEAGSVTLSQNPFIIANLGECEIKGVMCYALPVEGGQIFKINAENLNLVHLGRLTKRIDDATIEKLGTPDVLFLTVGDSKNYLSPELAAELVTTIEPRIVIPMGYHCDTDPKAGSLNEFIKTSGLKADITDKKIILKKKDLPSGETKLIVLEKNY